MKTTEVIIEILIAGTLVTAALLFFLWSWFPKDVAYFLEYWMTRGGSLPGAVLAVVLGAIAYSVGLLAEFVARSVWEGWLDGIKQERLGRFVQSNRNRLARSPSLREYYAVSDGAIEEDAGKKKFGQMRFEIIKLNSDLSREVESQISRLRLVRVLVLVELLFLAGTTLQWWRSNCSTPLLVLCLLLFSLLIINVFAIRYRFCRYCTNIERAYTILVLDPPRDFRQVP